MHRNITTIAAASVLLVACGDAPTGPQQPVTPAPAPTAAVTSNSWITRAPYPVTGIYQAAAASITNPATLRTTVYVVGGRPRENGWNNPTSAVRGYDAKSNTWRKLASYPQRVYSTNGAQVIDGKVYVSGGVSRRWSEESGRYFLEHLAALNVYDPATNAWTRKRDMPITSIHGLSAVYRNKLYVATYCYDSSFCGEDDYRGVLLRYNPSTDRWATLARIPLDLWDVAGGFIAGKLYLVDGEGAMYVYDPATDMGTAAGAPRPTRMCTASYATLQAKLYLVGCREDDDWSGVAPMLVYDPRTNAWTRRAAPPQAAAFGYSALSAVRLPDGQPGLQLIGGAEGASNFQYAP